MIAPRIATDAMMNDPSLEELHRLLKVPNQDQFDALDQAINQPEQLAQKVSVILADALELCRNNDQRLTEIISPIIEQTIHYSIKKNPRPLIEAMYPMIGSVIRRAVSENFKSMLQSFNHSLENIFTFKGISWRIEALLTGRSYAEIVMLKSLAFRVEQVFLIHRGTGLLLAQQSTLGVNDEGDMISGMLKAIQDFVHDSFKIKNDEQLETIQVGELSVWIEQGPAALLASVIRGDAPLELRTTFRSSLENIHQHFYNELNQFNGETAIFEEHRDLLTPCLQYQLKDETHRKPILAWVMIALILSGIIFWGGYRYYYRYQFNQLIQKLHQYPGLRITESGYRDGHYYIHGLKDRSIEARIPDSIAHSFIPAEIKWDWQAYLSLEPSVLLQTIRARLDPPVTVTLEMRGDTLVLSGNATQEWWDQASLKCAAIPGISYFIINTISSESDSIIKRLPSHPIYYPQNQSIPLDGQEIEIQEIKRLITEFLKLPNSNEYAFIIEGHTDKTGSETLNQNLSRRRAQNFLRDYIETDFPQLIFQIEAKGSTQPIFNIKDSDKNRRIVIILQKKDAEP